MVLEASFIHSLAQEIRLTVAVGHLRSIRLNTTESCYEHTLGASIEPFLLSSLHVRSNTTQDRTCLYEAGAQAEAEANSEATPQRRGNRNQLRARRNIASPIEPFTMDTLYASPTKQARQGKAGQQHPISQPSSDNPHGTSISILGELNTNRTCIPFHCIERCVTSVQSNRPTSHDICDPVICRPRVSE